MATGTGFLITEVDDVTVELVAAFERLLPQLELVGPGARRLGAGELSEIVHARGTHLFVARDPHGKETPEEKEPPEPRPEGRIVGSVTLVVFRIPSGLRARIESLVVDDRVRGRGLGQALCKAAIARARELGADSVDLTSAPARAAANRLYLRMGFELRDTNVYRLVFGRNH